MSHIEQSARIVNLFVLLALSVSSSECTEKVIPSSYTMQLLEGRAMAPVAGFIAQQRIEQFREYPYLYEGNLEEGLDIFEQLMNVPYSVAVVLYCNDEPVGYAAGMPLNFYLEYDLMESKEILAQRGVDSADYYYIADVIILPNHRGQSLVTHLFNELEMYAWDNGFEYMSLVCESYKRHPLKPVGYKELDGLWQVLGYEYAGFDIQGNWNTLQPIGAPVFQDHPLPYWVKKLQ